MVDLKCQKCGHVRTPRRCDECARRRARAWYTTNRVRAKATKRDYYKANATAAKQRAQRHAEDNREKRRESSRRFRQNHPEKSAAWLADYRARLKGAFVEHVDRELVYYRDFMRCYLCEKRITLEEMHVDHVVPLSKGGKHSKANCRASCPDCNLKKGAKL